MQQDGLKDAWDLNHEHNVAAFFSEKGVWHAPAGGMASPPPMTSVESSLSDGDSGSTTGISCSSPLSLSSNSSVATLTTPTAKRRRLADAQVPVCEAGEGGDCDASLESDFPPELLSAIQSIPYAAIRRMRRRMMRLPVLPKSDLRRSYLTMFSNTINSHDASLLKRFLTTYCQPTVELKHVGTGHTQYSSMVSPLLHTPGRSMTYYQSLAGQSEFMKNAFHLRRVQEIFAFFAVKNDLHPDNVCRFEDIRVITYRASDHIRLEGHFYGARTDIYEINPAIMYGLFANKLRQEEPSTLLGFLDADGEEEEEATAGGLHRFSHRLLTTTVNTLPFTSEPMLVHMEGRFVFIIGPDKRIEQIQLQPIGLRYTPVTIAGTVCC